jgi:hypothetical protein
MLSPVVTVNTVGGIVAPAPTPSSGKPAAGILPPRSARNASSSIPYAGRCEWHTTRRGKHARLRAVRPHDDALRGVADERVAHFEWSSPNRLAVRAEDLEGGGGGIRELVLAERDVILRAHDDRPSATHDFAGEFAGGARVLLDDRGVLAEPIDERRLLRA